MEHNPQLDYDIGMGICLLPIVPKMMDRFISELVKGHVESVIKKK